MPTAPTSEIGSANQASTVVIPGWGALGGGVVDDVETVPKLRWPISVRETYEAMRNDSQVEALYYATVLPILRWRWVIDPNGARDELVAKASRDYRLPIKGAPEGPVPRYRGRFSFLEHLRLVLLALLFGHYLFEQVGDIGDDGLWHVRKLAPRAPRTIDEFDVAPDGGLRSIRQTVARTGLRAESIPISRLVAYVWDQEPGRWTGRSMLRSIYREWLLKDRLLRVDGLKHERHGMGVPVARATNPDVSPQQLQAAQAVVNAWRAGEHASVTVPYGVDVDLKGVTGNLPDTIASIERHDQAMSRRWLGMLIELGQTQTGSRALGGEFSDLIEMAREAIGAWVVEVFSQHVLQDDVDWNYGEQEEFCPRLDYEKPDDAGAVEAPPVEEPETPLPLGAPVAASGRRGRAGRPKLYGAVRAALAEPTSRRRDLREHEVRAATDFEAVDAEWRDALTGLLDEWEDVTQAEIDDLVSQIEGAGGLADLAAVQATPAGAAVLAAAMRELARQGATTARGEIRAQGADDPDPDLAPVDAVLEQRAAAVDTLLSRSLSEAAGREALRLAGGALSNEQIAEGVRSHLEGLSTAYLEDRLGGAATTAQNYGRAAAFEAAEGAGGAGRYYASELLDVNTCENCAEIDGTEFASLDEVRAEYPTGGFVGCLGLDRCRGLAVAVFGED